MSEDTNDYIKDKMARTAYISKAYDSNEDEFLIIVEGGGEEGIALPVKRSEIPLIYKTLKHFLDVTGNN